MARKVYKRSYAAYQMLKAVNESGEASTQEMRRIFSAIRALELRPAEVSRWKVAYEDGVTYYREYQFPKVGHVCTATYVRF